MWSARTAKFEIRQVLFLFITRSGRLSEIRGPVYIAKSLRSLCIPFSRCICHLFVWWNIKFFHNSQWIPLPTKSRQVLNSFCVILLRSLIMWLIVSSLSPHNLHQLYCSVLSILALIWLVLTALFCAAIRRDSISLLKFPFVHVFLCKVSLVSRLKHP